VYVYVHVYENLLESNRKATLVITGTQVTLEAILRELATSETVDDLLAVHPELS